MATIEYLLEGEISYQMSETLYDLHAITLREFLPSYTDNENDVVMQAEQIIHDLLISLPLSTVLWVKLTKQITLLEKYGNDYPDKRNILGQLTLTKLQEEAITAPVPLVYE